MDKRNFAFDKTNFIILAVGMVVVILGFILMSGSLRIFSACAASRLPPLYVS